MTDSQAFIPDYSRQVRLSAVGPEGQARLGLSRVLVIGAGGLGCPALTYLAGAGIGHIGIVDGDVLEASNLHRQTLYDAADVGKRKVELAAARLRALNPTVSITTIGHTLAAEDILPLFAEYDLVLECTDDMRSRYLCNDAAVLTGTPVVYASVYQYEGQLHLYQPTADAPCLRCMWPVEPDPAQLGSCAVSGVLGPVPGVLGTMQANEALKILLGLGSKLEHDLLLMDLLDMDIRRIGTGHAGHDCHAQARQGLERRRASEALEQAFPSLQAAVLAGYRLVDLRESDEIEGDPLDAAALWIPSGDIARHAASFAHGRWLLICARGARSRHSAEWLRRHGYRNVFSLRDGWIGLRTRTSPAA
ncbi:HesA/MoeB/ThiF family protein [Dyella sp.]|uniref:HesA/MoeB/ThiF family protein n=1 Tax=Dyella sp. TaxID=1869338 RepID=UPI002ED591FC